MRITNWVLIAHADRSPLPQGHSRKLRGDVYGHPRFPDGYRVTTTRIVGTRDGRIVTRSGSHYELGDPQPLYEAVFPGAKQRLLENLTQV